MTTEIVDEYRQLKRVNISNLKHMRKSPLAYRWNLDHPVEDKPAFAFGRAVHCATFEPAKFVDHYIAWRFGRRAGSAYNDFVEQNKEREILTVDEFDRVIAIRDIVRNHPEVKPFLAAGEAEARILWTDPDTGLLCKGRADWISASKPAVLDLKTTRNLARFQNDCAKFDYHLQGAFYPDGVRLDTTRGQDLPFVFAAVESEPPHDLGVFVCSGEAQNAGRNEYKRLLERVSYCEKSNTWPGAFEFPQELLLPKWALGADSEELALTMDGEQLDI